MKNAKALMLQGTGSGVGKSVIVAGLCRIFRDMGVKVAPFKAQNMALNSFITKEGGEIGRAQALQAEAAGIEPSIDMNPILLKATGDASSQVILNGRVYGNMNAIDYYSFKEEAWEVVTSAYDRLSKSYEVIVIEGAGSPAEINLMDDEIVNMRVARYTGAPVILVGDIDRGGVFASLYGTIELLKDNINPTMPTLAKEGNTPTPLTPLDRGDISPPLETRPGMPLSAKRDLGGFCDADYIKAFIINKFRGDIEILRPGLRMLEDKTGRPVIGVISYLGDLGLHEEDGLALERISDLRSQISNLQKIRVVVLRLRYISNFTDFDPFLYEPDVELIYSIREGDINTADLIIIPGSKNTIKDLLFLRDNGLEDCIRSAVKKGTPLIGICGGYQMLGRRIYDPYGIEGDVKEIDGLGLLDIETNIERTKMTSQVEAEMVQTSNLKSQISNLLKGYEIHMGISKGDIGLFKVSRLCSNSSPILDGSMNGNVWGTYIHGIFDNDEFRRSLLNSVREKKGLSPVNNTIKYHELKETAIARWADVLRNSVDICFILRLLGMEQCMKDYIQNHWS
ncbi:MAG: cobyric acid synthase [Thermodesulfovibrionia bacterium]